jgi:PKD repeat protein
MPDPIDNFMDYGNVNCHNAFTAGQGQRMRNLITTQRSGLLVNKCSAPCTETIKASYTRNNLYPLVGNVITFTNTSTGAVNYQWLVDGVSAATSPNFSRSFPAKGRYKVTLKAFNNTGCYATFTQYVIVTCGVTARFYTDKRTIASKSPFFVDTVTFINTSEGATSYKWLMRNDKGMAEQVVSTSATFSYAFPTPALYSVRLIAANGPCTDTTEIFTITVYDPTPNGVVNIINVQCFQYLTFAISDLQIFLPAFLFQFTLVIQMVLPLKGWLLFTSRIQ